MNVTVVVCVHVGGVKYHKEFGINVRKVEGERRH